MPKPYGEVIITPDKSPGYPSWIVRQPECPTCGEEGLILAVCRRRGDAEICAEALGTLKNED